MVTDCNCLLYCHLHLALMQTLAITYHSYLFHSNHVYFVFIVEDSVTTPPVDPEPTTPEPPILGRTCNFWFTQNVHNVPASTLRTASNRPQCTIFRKLTIVINYNVGTYTTYHGLSLTMHLSLLVIAGKSTTSYYSLERASMLVCYLYEKQLSLHIQEDSKLLFPEALPSSSLERHPHQYTAYPRYDIHTSVFAV